MKALNTLLALIPLVLLTSCDTDELCYEHPHDGYVTIQYDWSEAPDAKPEGMRLWVYAADRDFSQPYDIPADGGTINLKNGIYNFISHNNDLEWINTHGGNSFIGHYATTRECDILEPMYGNAMRSEGLRGDDDERVFATPERFWTGNVEGHNVELNRIVRIKPTEYTAHYTFEFRNVGSVKHIRKLSASISGMAAEVMLVNGTLSSEPVTLALEAHIGNQRKASNTIVGDFYTFGHNTDVAAPHRMALYIELDTGKKIKFTQGDYLDVTAQIHNAADPRNVHIIIDGIDLPDPIENGSGISPGVDDWTVEELEIKM